MTMTDDITRMKGPDTYEASYLNNRRNCSSGTATVLHRTYSCYYYYYYY